MALYLTNIMSLFARRQMSMIQSSLDTSYERLASGKRINSAKDDPAGLQIANRLSSEIDGLKQGNRNAQDGISIAQTVEGALDEVSVMLQRVRTLALQSANGTNSTADRAALNGEARQMYEEINRISQDATYAGAKILDGSKGIINIQVGAYANQTIAIDLSQSFSVEEMAKRAGTDAEVAFVNGFDISTAENAQNVLANIDALIAVVDGKRGELGGVQNRLESTIRYQSLSIENLSESRSRIEDTDYAEETSNLVQKQIQMQAAVAVLTQANNSKSFILQLLEGI